MSMARHGSLRGIAVVGAGLALALAVGVGVLVWRALGAIDREQRLRHQMVAERLFDEVERKLTAVVQREEARPFAQWRYFYVPETQVAGSVALANSPLAELPTEDFIVGYFQIDPDGSFQSPLFPRNEELARLANGWAPTPQATRVVDEMRFLCSDLARPGAVAVAGRTRQPAPGDTTCMVHSGPPAPVLVPAPAVQELEQQRFAANQADLAMPQGAAPNPPPGQSASMLSSLNSGFASRSARGDWNGKSQAQTVYTFQEPGADNRMQQAVAGNLNQVLPAQGRYAPPSKPALAAALPGVAPASPGAVAAPPGVAPALPGGLPWPPPATGSEPAPSAIAKPPAGAAPAAPADLGDAGGNAARYVYDGVENALKVGANDQVDVCMTPLRGHVAASDRLLLHREVRISGRLYRQGLAVRLPELTTHLAKGMLDQEPLRSHAALAWSQHPAELRGDDGRHAFTHRFAEPFAVLQATALLHELPGEASTSRGDVYALLTALVAAAALGLFALARMVTVAVHFARRRNDFVSAVSHELKTPLTAIRLHGEMLRDGMVADDARRQDYYRTITAECERLSRLVNNVLELARLEKGERRIETRIGPVGPLLRELAAIVEPHVRASGFAFVVEVADDGPSVRYDRDALLQVLINLVDNALKFARHAVDKQVTVRCHGDGERVLLSVRDRGPGVPARQLARIFQPFYRGERELTRTTTGTGIGLSLVKGLSEAMGALVQARNLPEGGFEVEVALLRG